MAVDYKELSAGILAGVGGKDNISSFTNCMTRLRIDLVDPAKVDQAKIKGLDGVMGIVPGDQLQIIVGPGHAARLRNAFQEVSGIEPGAEVDDDVDVRDVADETKAKVKAHQQTSVHAVFRHIGNIFIPIIPAFIACALVGAITNIWIMADPTIKLHPWFLALAGLASLCTGSLNLLVGYNTAKEFGGTPALGLIAGAVPYMTSLGGIAATAKAAAQPLSIPLFGNLQPALGGVVGVIVTAWVFTIIEKQFRKIVPAALDLFLVPFVTLIVGAALCIFIIMPISALLMRGVTWLLINFALERGGVFGGFLLGALFLPLVMLGIHQGLSPIHAQLIAQYGYTQLLPVLAMAGAGQVGMGLAILVKTKNERLKTILKSALPIGFLGVGEPLIYGVSLPMFYPFITACLGGGFGGAFIAMGMKISGAFGATGIGLSGILLTGLISNGMWLWYIGGLVVAYIFGFILTYFFGFKEHMVERLG